MKQKLAPTVSAIPFDYPVGDRITGPAGGWEITQYMGNYNSSFGGRHLAQDIWNGSDEATAHQPIYAVADGVVEYAGPNDSLYRYTVVIRHDIGNGQSVCSFYGHIDGGSKNTPPPVHTGETVTRGTRIANVMRWKDYYPADDIISHLHYSIISGELCDFVEQVGGKLCGYDRSTVDLSPEPYSMTAINDICGDSHTDGFISPSQFIGRNRSTTVFEPLPPSSYPPNWNFGTGGSALGTSIAPQGYTLEGSVAAESESFVVPVNAQSLRFEYIAGDLRDGNWTGRIEVEVLSGPGFATVTRIDNSLITGTGTQDWKTVILDLQQFQGQTIKLRFRNWDWPGRSQVRNPSLRTETPSWTPSFTADVQIRNGSGAPNGLGSYLQIRGSNHATSEAFTIPAEAQSVRFDFQTGDSRDGNYTGRFFVEVLSGSGFMAIERIDGDTTFGKLNQGWRTAVLDVQKFRGMTVKFRFRNWDWPGLTRIANITLNIETPDWVPGDSKVVRLSTASVPTDPGVTAPENATFEPSTLARNECAINCDFNIGGSALVLQITPDTYALEGSATQDSAPFQVPANAETVHFEYLAGDSRDGAYVGTVFVTVVSGDGFSVITRIDDGAVRGSTTQGWKDAVLNVQQFQGQTVKLRFGNWDWPGRSRVRNILLHEETPRWIPSFPASVKIKSDGDGLSGSGAYLELNGNVSVTSVAFTVPSSAQSLRFDFQSGDSRDGYFNGLLQVEVLSEADFSRVTRLDGAQLRGSTTEGWKKAVVDVQAFQGQTVKLRLSNWDWPGKTRIDNLTFLSEIDGWKPSNSTAATVDAASEPPTANVLTPPNGTFEPGPASICIFNCEFSQPGTPLGTVITPPSGEFTGAAFVESSAFVVPDATQSVWFDYQAGDFRDDQFQGELQVYVLSGPDFSISTRIDNVQLRSTRSQGWRGAVLDLQAFRGQTVKLSFRNWDWPGIAQVQNPRLHLDTPGWESSLAPNVQILDDANSRAGSGPYLQIDGSQSATSLELAVPADAQSLRFDYQIGDSRDVSYGGQLYVEVLSGVNFATTTRIDEGLLQGTLQQGWKSAQLDLQKFRGQTIQLRFRNWDWPGRSRLDNLRIAVEIPEWKPSSVTGVQRSEDSSSLPDGAGYLRISGAQSATSAPFRVPLGAQSLAFDFMTGDSRDPDWGGTLYVEVLSGPGFSIATRIDRSLIQGTISQGWRKGVLDLRAFRGRTVQVRFQNWDWPGLSRIDNVALEHDENTGATFVPAPTGSGTHLLLTGGDTVTSAPFKVAPEAENLRFDYMAGDYRDGSYGGSLQVYVLSGPEFSVITRIDNGSTQGTLNEGWKFRELDLRSFRGRTIQLRFQNWDWPGRALVDNISFTGSATGTLPSESDVNPTQTYVTINGASYVTSEAFTVTAGNTVRSFSFQTGDSRDGAWIGRIYVEVVTNPDAISGTRVDNDQISGRLIEGWKQGSVDLSGYTGQTVRLRFRNWDWPGFTRLAFTP
ncbi:M23 family metallopeptidase [Hyalangium versicolor]|uniref:M23 family metallopeptidase n=1 Tax=Hyalangium versicolor TaxID=2861190 RepID=UPI001CCBDA0C|nr:M23 family metallopeptidase [Hyalangium versicolor]